MFICTSQPFLYNFYNGENDFSSAEEKVYLISYPFSFLRSVFFAIHPSQIQRLLCKVDEITTPHRHLPFKLSPVSSFQLLFLRIWRLSRPHLISQAVNRCSHMEREMRKVSGGSIMGKARKEEIVEMPFTHLIMILSTEHNRIYASWRRYVPCTHIHTFLMTLAFTHATLFIRSNKHAILLAFHTSPFIISKTDPSRKHDQLVVDVRLSLRFQKGSLKLRCLPTFL